MIDLKLNNAGDIMTTKQKTYGSLKFGWSDASLVSMKISFKTSRSITPPPGRESPYGEPLHLVFVPDEAESKKSTIVVTDMDEVRQRIILRVRSNAAIIKQKHNDITAEDVITAIENATYSCIEDLLENPSVKVEKKHCDGPFSWQNLDIYIYDGKTEIYNFRLEG